MNKTLTCLFFGTLLLLPAAASADDSSSVPAPEEPAPAVAPPGKARPAPRPPRRADRAERARRAEASGSTPAPDAASRPLLHRFGSCSAARFAALTAEIGRLSAIERCTGRGDARTPGRRLSRTAPRQSDLGIPEEAFDPEFEVTSR